MGIVAGAAAVASVGVCGCCCTGAAILPPPSATLFFGTGRIPLFFLAGDKEWSRQLLEAFMISPVIVITALAVAVAVADGGGGGGVDGIVGIVGTADIIVVPLIFV